MGSGYLSDPGKEPESPALQVDSLPAELPGKPLYIHRRKYEFNMIGLWSS